MSFRAVVLLWTINPKFVFETLHSTRHRFFHRSHTQRRKKERKKKDRRDYALVVIKMESIEATLKRDLNASSSSRELSPKTLSAFFDALEPGGRLGIFVLKGGGGSSTYETKEKEEASRVVSKALTLEGFEDVVSEATRVSGTDATVVSGRKPQWERGVKFSLEKKTKKTVSASAWEDDDQDEMIDEDALLTEKDKAKPTEGEGVGCPPTRKPCKDCTCGRKEEEEMKENATPGTTTSSVVKMDLENDPNDETFKSACGNCALGDAFRCAGCPYLGQPAFKENDGEGKVVMLDDLGTVDL